MVCLYRLGYYTQSTHRRDPIATRLGLFELLCFQPHPVRVSLNDLDITSSLIIPISMPSSMRTPVQREIMHSSDPNLKPSSISGLPVAWITEPATDPSRKKEEKIMKQLRQKFTWLKMVLCTSISFNRTAHFVIKNKFCFV